MTARGLSVARSVAAMLGIAAAAAMPVAARAQSCTAIFNGSPCTVSTSTTMTAGSLMQLTLSPASTALTAPGTAEYDAGYVTDTGPAATVKANRGWQLQLHASSATWTASGPLARADKPRGDLRWATSAAGPFSATTGTSAAVATGAATGGATTQIHYRTLYGWTTDPPGTYSLTVVLTLVAN